jgi:hypothetical protein
MVFMDKKPGSTRAWTTKYSHWAVLRASPRGEILPNLHAFLSALLGISSMDSGSTHNVRAFVDFRRSDFASPSFGGFAFVGSLTTLAQFSFRFMALRHQVSLILRFGSRSVLTTPLAMVLDA